MDIRRKKNRLRKEMALLIDSIKEHSDYIGNKDHVAQLELEVINSKIKKLYEKSVVFGYLHALSEEESQEISNNLGKTNKKIEDQATNSIVPTGEEKGIHVEIASPELITPSNQEIEEQKSNTETQTICTIETVAESVVKTVVAENKPQEAIKLQLRDVKEFIGLNDKIQFVSVLFKSDITRYEYFISKLNASQNSKENNNVITDFQKLMSWKDEDEAFQNLLSVTQLRYK